MPKIRAEHEDNAHALEESLKEGDQNQAEQDSEVFPYGKPLDLEREQELDFDN